MIESLFKADMVKLGKAIQEARIQRKMSLPLLARMAWVNAVLLEDIEAGAVNLSMKDIYKISYALNFRPGILLLFWRIK